ncbi:MAG: glycogen synthase [Verrucomicrobiota bacterium]
MDNKRLKILQVTPELAPYAKVGGLADVAGAITKEMARAGHDVKTLCPKYGILDPEKEGWAQRKQPLSVHLGGGREEFAQLWQTTYPGSDAEVYFLEFNLFYGGGIYDGGSGNPERFTFLCRAAIDFCHSLQWWPDVIHCHDWGVGLLPVFLNTTERQTPLHRAASVFTIHNLQHQGRSGPGLLDFAGLPSWLFSEDNLEHAGALNMMKGALYHSTKLTTVSPHYAREIQGPDYGCGLDGILRYRSADLVGVLNGIDTDAWNPGTDPMIPTHFTADDISGKAVCKAKLQETFGLEQRPDVPIFSAIARLYDQKGLDIFAEIIPGLMNDMDLQVVVLGSGDPGLEGWFNELAARFPGRVGVYIGYNNGHSHLIEAGSDFFVMPSRFEPCGLNQMYSMQYGTLPIVRETGGLVDSVEQYVPGRGEGTGFRFHEMSPHALYYTIGWANETWWDHPEEITQLRHNAMSQDLSWSRSAERYEELFHWAVEARLRGLGITTGLTQTPFKAPV